MYTFSSLTVGLSVTGLAEKKKKRERKKPVVLLEDDKELSPSDMEVSEASFLFIHPLDHPPSSSPFPLLLDLGGSGLRLLV